MKICGSCVTPNGPSAKKCKKCGEAFYSADTGAPAPAPQPSKPAKRARANGNGHDTADDFAPGYTEDDKLVMCWPEKSEIMSLTAKETAHLERIVLLWKQESRK